MIKCKICKQEFDESDAYEYRGAFSCSDHFDEMVKDRDFERAEVIAENDSQTKVFKGLDLGDSIIGKANRDLLKPQIEIAKKETTRTKLYERGEL